jgi:phosphoglycerate dehydrogenase-like enzyme
MLVWIAHEQGRALLGELPETVGIEVCADAGAVPSDPSAVRFWVPPFASAVHPSTLLPRLTGLDVVQLLSAGADAWVGQLPDGVRLCDARGVHDPSTSEWVLAATLAALRRFPAFVRAQQRREWAFANETPTDELTGKRVLLIGAGSIGAAIAAKLAPFDVALTKVARTARPADGVHGVAALPDLLPHAEIVVLVVPLTDRTRGLVDAGFLKALPDGALLVNASRGPVVDTDALLAELRGGRIRAALDVTDPEPLPAEHPLWDLSNVLLTPHVGGAVRGLLPRAYRLAGDQLRRYLAGAPLINAVVDGY